MRDGDLEKLLKDAYPKDAWFANPSNVTSLTQENGLWYSRGKLVLPNDRSIKDKIMFELHDAPYSGHHGMQKTYRAIARSFWWPNAKQDIHNYVRECVSCQRNKNSNLLPAGLLAPLPIPGNPWDSVSMDFITQLPKTKEGYDAILVFVDRLTKMTHLARTRTNVTGEGTAQLFIEHVWKHHGIPINILSDRGSVFVGKFLTEMLRLIGTKQLRSTAYHPQTDGQTERVNKVLEDMLRHYVGQLDHTDWDQCLAAAEFAINNSFHESIGTTPFRLNCGRDPRLPLAWIPGYHFPFPDKSTVPAAANFADRMAEGLSHAKKCLEAAQQRQKRYYDQHHRDLSFAAGDMVMLNTKNIHMRTAKGRRSTPKLMPKWVGPFKVLKRVGDSQMAYVLDLPETMKIHNVFHVSLLKLYHHSARAPAPTSFIIEGQQYWMVERILDHRIVKQNRQKVLQYLIKWLDFGAEHTSWEPAENIEESEDGKTVAAYWDYIGLEPPIPRSQRDDL